MFDYRRLTVAHIEDTTESDERDNEGATGMFGGLTAREASARAAEVRAEKKRQRAEDAADASRSFREKVGVGLAALSQGEVSKAIQGLARSGKPADLRALAVLADQAFGKPTPAPDADPQGLEGVKGLDREARAALLAALDELPDTPGAAATPLPPESSESRV